MILIADLIYKIISLALSASLLWRHIITSYPDILTMMHRTQSTYIAVILGTLGALVGGTAATKLPEISSFEEWAISNGEHSYELYASLRCSSKTLCNTQVIGVTFVVASVLLRISLKPSSYCLFG